jgi:pimeloyl-ACP methyl ester carboxylesterase
MAAGADLTPLGQAKLIRDFLDALDLCDVTAVANDTGGALTQILMARHPDRVARVVLTPSDSFERVFRRCSVSCRRWREYPERCGCSRSRCGLESRTGCR